MAGIDIKATNIALASALETAGLVTKAHYWPVESVAPGEAIVGYPSELNLTTTFGRGSDSAVIPVWFICGLPGDEATLTLVSNLVIASTNVVNTLEAAVTGSVHVAFGAFEPVTIGQLDRLALRFDVELMK